VGHHKKTVLKDYSSADDQPATLSDNVGGDADGTLFRRADRFLCFLESLSSRSMRGENYPRYAESCPVSACEYRRKPNSTARK
jgi:hypothetical protein